MNASRLELARLRRGLTKKSLTNLLRVDAKTYRAYESGASVPPREKLLELAAYVKFPVEFFEGKDLNLPTKENVSFRSMKMLSAAKRDMALAQGALALHVSRWLQERFELPKQALPDLRYESDPEIAAATLRQLWGLGELPIRNMVHLLEAQGVRVFSLSIDAKQVDAFSMWQDDQAFVLLNTFKSAEHSRFDAAHELGHLVLHRHGPIRGKEPEADAHRFASAFLMPKGSVIAHRPRFPTVAEFVRIKKIWGVSIAALNHRLHALNQTTDWHYRSLCVEIAQKGYRTYEPEEMPRETSLILPKLLANLYENDGLTRSQIAAALSIPQSEFEGLMFGLVLSGINGRRRGEPRLTNPTGLRRVK